MERTILVIVLFCIFSNPAFCQYGSTRYKNGGYRNHLDFKDNRPFCEPDFIIVKKYNKKIPQLYKVLPHNRSVKKKTIKNEIWGIYDGYAFYLNAYRLGMTEGYIKTEVSGQYSYFKGVPIMTMGQEARLNNAARNYGLSGVLIASLFINSRNKNKVHYVLNLNTGMVNLLTKDYMYRILQSNEELLVEFKNAVNKDSIEVLLRYLNKINQ